MRGADRERFRQALALAHSYIHADSDANARTGTAQSRHSARAVLDCDAVAIARPDGVALTLALGVRSTERDSVADSKPFSITQPSLTAMLGVWRRKLS